MVTPSQPTATRRAGTHRPKRTGICRITGWTSRPWGWDLRCQNWPSWETLSRASLRPRPTTGRRAPSYFPMGTLVSSSHDPCLGGSLPPQSLGTYSAPCHHSALLPPQIVGPTTHGRCRHRSRPTTARIPTQTSPPRCSTYPGRAFPARSSPKKNRLRSVSAADGSSPTSDGRNHQGTQRRGHALPGDPPAARPPAPPVSAVYSALEKPPHTSCWAWHSWAGATCLDMFRWSRKTTPCTRWRTRWRAGRWWCSGRSRAKTRSLSSCWDLQHRLPPPVSQKHPATKSRFLPSSMKQPECFVTTRHQRYDRQRPSPTHRSPGTWACRLLSFGRCASQDGRTWACHQVPFVSMSLRREDGIWETTKFLYLFEQETTPPSTTVEFGIAIREGTPVTYARKKARKQVFQYVVSSVFLPPCFFVFPFPFFLPLSSLVPCVTSNFRRRRCFFRVHTVASLPSRSGCTMLRMVCVCVCQFIFL